jgi:hypothetical protein
METIFVFKVSIRTFEHHNQRTHQSQSKNERHDNCKKGFHKGSVPLQVPTLFLESWTQGPRPSKFRLPQGGGPWKKTQLIAGARTLLNLSKLKKLFLFF